MITATERQRPSGRRQFRAVRRQVLAGMWLWRLELRTPFRQTLGSTGRNCRGGDDARSIRERAVPIQIEPMIIRRHDGFTVGSLDQEGTEALVAENDGHRWRSAGMTGQTTGTRLMENRPHQGQSGGGWGEPVQAESERRILR